MERGGPGSGAEELLGVVCNLGLYGFLEDRCVMQCLFLQVTDDDPPRSHLRSFAVCGPELPIDRNVRLNLRRTYLSAFSEALEHRTAAMHDRSRCLTDVFLRSTPLLAELAKVLRPLRIMLDRCGVEILAARPATFPGWVDLIHMYDVARIVAIGSYSDAADGGACDRGGDGACTGGQSQQIPWTRRYRDPSLGSDGMMTLERDKLSIEKVSSARINRVGSLPSRSPEGCCDYDRYTQASKKLCRGYNAVGVIFSIRTCGSKCVFDESIGSWPVKELFSVRDVPFRGTILRLVEPLGFVAAVISEEQCLLTLRVAVRRLFASIYSGFGGIQPVFDYLGPDCFPEGGPRSFFFTGFPVYVYSVDSPASLLTETVEDAMHELMSECGLPDIVGQCGKLEISARSPCPALLPPDEVMVFFTPHRPIRINGNEVRSAGAAPDDDSSMYVHVSDRTIVCVSVPELRERILQSCVNTGDYPVLFRDGVKRRRSSRDVCSRFIERLRHRSGGLYAYVRGLENFVSQHVTSACTAAGMSWVLVRDDVDFFIAESREAGGGGVDGNVRAQSAEVCVRTVFGCYWKKLFGSRLQEPVCVTLDRAPAVMLVANDRIIGHFDSHADDHWSRDAGETVTEIIVSSLRDPEWLGFQNLKAALRSLALRFIGRRHHTNFWLERFEPTRQPVAPHGGVHDCAPFYGVWGTDGRVLLQFKDAALHDGISYGAYLARVFEYTRACLCIAVRETAGDCSVADLEDTLKMIRSLVSSVEAQICADYLGLFGVN